MVIHSRLCLGRDPIESRQSLGIVCFRNRAGTEQKPTEMADERMEERGEKGGRRTRYSAAPVTCIRKGNKSYLLHPPLAVPMNRDKLPHPRLHRRLRADDDSGCGTRMMKRNWCSKYANEY